MISLNETNSSESYGFFDRVENFHKLTYDVLNREAFSHYPLLQIGDLFSIGVGKVAFIATRAVLLPIEYGLKFFKLNQTASAIVNTIALGIQALIRGLFLAPLFIISLFLTKEVSPKTDPKSPTLLFHVDNPLFSPQKPQSEAPHILVEESTQNLPNLTHFNVDFENPTFSPPNQPPLDVPRLRNGGIPNFYSQFSDTCTYTHNANTNSYEVIDSSNQVVATDDY